MRHNIKLLIAYDGSEFYGWQQTSLGPSIEEELKKVLEKILQEKIVLQAASRTDRAVHAEGQVVNFFLEKRPPSFEKLLLSANSLLPSAIRLLDAKRAPLSFHPTLDALSKEYHYLILNHPIALPKYRRDHWHIFASLDLKKMGDGAKYLLGTHDFSAFCNRKKNPSAHNIRTMLSLRIIPLSEKRVRIEMRANAFLFRMARNIAGFLVGVGLGVFAPHQTAEILASKKRPLAGVTAPPHGLFLKRVYY